MRWRNEKIITVTFLILTLTNLLQAQYNKDYQTLSKEPGNKNNQLINKSNAQFSINKTRIKKQGNEGLPRNIAEALVSAGLNDHNYDFEDIYFVDAKIGWEIDWWVYVLKTEDGGDNWWLQKSVGSGPRALYFSDANN